MEIPHGTYDYIRHSLLAESKRMYTRQVHGYVGLPNAPSKQEIDFIMAGVSERIKEMQLIEEYGYWAVHPDFPREDWVYSVQNDDSRTGYWQWVAKQIEEEEEDGSSG